MRLLATYPLITMPVAGFLAIIRESRAKPHYCGAGASGAITACIRAIQRYRGRCSSRHAGGESYFYRNPQTVARRTPVLELKPARHAADTRAGRARARRGA